MNSKLSKQLNQIVDSDMNTTMQKRTLWYQAAQRRMNFIKELLSEMEDMVFENKKDRSSYYSKAVINYDKNNMIVFYN